MWSSLKNNKLSLYNKGATHILVCSPFKPLVRGESPIVNPGEINFKRSLEYNYK